MKKFYAMIAAALMSVSVFAGGTPSASDLAGFMEAGYYVACFSAPAAETCNEIVWIGTYDGWNAADPDKIVCEPLTGFDGWYVAKVPVTFKEDGVTPDNCGKPVQLNECGKFDWAYQCGKFGTIELKSGHVDINSDMDGAETKLENWSTTEPTIVSMSAWKASPCANACEEHPYEIRLFDPFCESHTEFLPYIRGNFNAWGPAVPMTLRDTTIDGDDASVYVYVTEPLSGVLEVKWNNSPEKDNWGNQFQVYVPEDTENDVEAHWTDLIPDKFVSDANLSTMPYVTKKNNYSFEFDLSDNTKYRYGQCAPTESFTVNLTAPAGAPEVGVEMVGSFKDGGWDNGILMTLSAGIYTATVECSGSAEFKFRALGNWDIQIQKYYEKDGLLDWYDMGNLKFEDLANAGVIDLDFSDPEEYRWSAAQGIETVGLTKRAQKVVVDGVLYIVRDNKMFSVQGTQVR